MTRPKLFKFSAIPRCQNDFNDICYDFQEVITTHCVPSGQTINNELYESIWDIIFGWQYFVSGPYATR